jgi:allophanate hydrolase
VSTTVSRAGSRGIGGAGPTERVELALTRIEASDRAEVWIELIDRERALDDARAVQARLTAGDGLALAGVTVAVKDNIDVAGVPTTAGCPAFAYTPSADAPVVARLRAAGAIVLGKTNLDQFATGLVGTRTPYGAVRDARDPRRVAGGSSAGSAMAVALGQVDLGLGTDTAGSGRIPAAFQGIVGLKPTRGLIPTTGVVPACRSFDCVSLFARTVAEAEAGLEAVAGPWPPDAPLGAPPTPRIAIASPERLELLSAEARAALGVAIERLRAAGAEVAEIELGPFLSAGALLYAGAFVAERYAAVGAFIAEHPDAVDPYVAEIILGGGSISAERYVADCERLEQYRQAAFDELQGFDALLLPTAPFQPTIAEVAESPLELNRQLGTYTSFANLLDLCAISVPAGEADAGCFGVSLYAPPFREAVLADLAGRLTGESRQRSRGPIGVGGPPASQLLVVGAHMSAQPLNGQLTDRGARLIRRVATAPEYRLYALATTPPKPGLVRAAAVGAGNRARIEGELWELPPAGLASLLSELPAPMALGPVNLEDGSSVVGFLCEPAALEGATEITGFGGWRQYLASR